MSRPRLCRNIEFNPNVTYFKPQGVPIRDLDIIELSIEEMEAYRLRHVEGLNQNKSALQMKTSQSTYQRILNNAYKKVALALVRGKAIKIIKNNC